MTTAKKPGRPRIDASKRSDMQRQIVEIAGQLFTTEGFGAVSMRRIANDLGVSPMTLYKYYPSKLAMLSRLWTEIFEEVFELIEKGTRNTNDPDEKLRAMSRIYVSFWMEHREKYHLVFMSSGLSREDVQSFVSQQSTLSLFQVFFATMAKAWEVDVTDPANKQRTDQLVACLHGVMHSLITMQGYPWTDSDVLVSSIVSSVLPVSVSN